MLEIGVFCFCTVSYNYSLLNTTKYLKLDSRQKFKYNLIRISFRMKTERFKFILKIVELEAVLWFAGLIYLLTVNPYEVQQFSFCPFHNLGITFCPGCGLGRSISFIYHGDLFHSLQTHPLGVIALILISIRIIKLSNKMYHNYHKTKEVIYG